MFIDEFHDRAQRFDRALREEKANLARTGFDWYPYSILGSVEHLDRLLVGDYRHLPNLIHGARIADIGGADGDLAFFLEDLGLGLEVDLIDNRVTNWNQLRGARRLHEARGSSVRIVDVDLDVRFDLPREYYDFIFLLGILYHLKNPFFALERLSIATKYCFLSTRVARYTHRERLNIEREPLAYLVGSDELNADPTNFWIFSEAGLRRLLSRCGWSVCAFMTRGNTSTSDPTTTEGDERAYCLIRSRRIWSAKLDGEWHDPESEDGVVFHRWTRERAVASLLTGPLGRIVIDGRVPTDVLRDVYSHRVRLAVTVDGDPVWEHVIEGDGHFALELRAPPNRLVTLEFAPSKTFRGERVGLIPGDASYGVQVGTLESF